ncbi:MAG: hypothetical protein ACK4SX_09320 [Alcanivoracaceae bacterium]
MKQVKNIFFALFISPEAVVAFLIFLWFFLNPTSLETFGAHLKSDTDVWKYLPSLVLIFAGTAFRFSFKIRAPLDSSFNRILYEWPLYPLLVARVMVGLIFATCSGALGLATWIFGQHLDDLTVGAMFFLAAGVSATTALTMMLAYQKLRELIERYG